MEGTAWAVFTFFFGCAFALVSMTPADYRVARACFAVASFALAAGAAYSLNRTPILPLLQYAIAAAAAIAFAIGCQRWVTSRENAAIAAAASGPDPGDRLRFLAGQIERFVMERDAADPDDPSNMLALRRRPPVRLHRDDGLSDEEAVRRRHASETLNLYEVRLGAQVLAAANDLRRLGVARNDTERLADYPRDLAAIREKVELLRKFAAQVATPDIANLEREQRQHAGQIAALESRIEYRRLDPEVSAALSRALGDRLAAYLKPFPDPIESDFRFTVQILSIGTERETLAYRADFERAFLNGGFAVETGHWIPGSQPVAPFTGQVTLIEVDPAGNFVRGDVIAAALKDAGVPFREAPYPPIGAKASVTDTSGTLGSRQIAASIIIGQRD